MNNRLESKEPAQDSMRDDSPLPQPNPKARALHAEIIARLKGLLSADAASPLDPLFKSGYADILKLFDAYQREIIAVSDYRVTCKKNCSLCCYHWVADVYSFEAAIIAEHIKACLPQNIAALCAVLREDATLLQQLDDALDERVLKDAAPHTLAALDRDDLLLEGFYQLRRPCALLDSQGACSIYRLRPMSCRTYLSFSDPLLCDPDTIYYHEVRTCLCTLEDEADELLGELHERYDSCGGDTSLRTLLPYYLEGFRDCILKRVI
jgi:Fe-S-cluster containining protein